MLSEASQVQGRRQRRNVSSQNPSSEAGQHVPDQGSGHVNIEPHDRRYHAKVPLPCSCRSRPPRNICRRDSACQRHTCSHNGVSAGRDRSQRLARRRACPCRPPARPSHCPQRSITANRLRPGHSADQRHPGCSRRFRRGTAAYGCDVADGTYSQFKPSPPPAQYAIGLHRYAPASSRLPMRGQSFPMDGGSQDCQAAAALTS